jgi:hypothetical protein
MVAYEFYWRDETGKTHLIGILPERRKDPNRVNDETIMNWVKKLMGEGVNNIFFNQVTMDDLETLPKSSDS